jgi:hypothetical protein
MVVSTRLVPSQIVRCNRRAQRQRRITEDNGSHDDGGGGAESTQDAIASDVEKAIRETVAAHPEHRLKQREEESREAQLRRRRQKRAARRIAAK